MQQRQKPLILDLHSYSDEQALSIGKKPPFPDVCIAINDKYVDTKILKYIIDRIVSLGLSYQINYPYSGLLFLTILITLDTTNLLQLCSKSINVFICKIL